MTMPAFTTTSSTDYLGHAYALLLVGGGIMGAVKRQSWISFVAGLGTGGAAEYGARRFSTNQHDVLPSLYASSFVLALMAWRFYKTNKFMPAGLVMIMSLGMVVYYALAAL